MAEFKSGFVSIIGRPNVGKSTLLNRIIGQKIAITSSKAQTTRKNTRGIHTTDDYQIVFIDTPGIHKAKNRLGSYMVKSALDSVSDSDLVWLIVDGTKDVTRVDLDILENLKSIKDKPIFLLINKIDEVKKEELFKTIDEYKDRGVDFKEIFLISATQGDQVEELVETTVEEFNEGPKFFNDDDLSDQSQRFLASEIIREEILKLVRQEVPHSIFVEIESFKESEDIIDISANIIVERASQKNIIIGSKGSMIKQIGQNSRQQLEIVLENKVYLETWVRVKEDWRKKESFLRENGFGD